MECPNCGSVDLEENKKKTALDVKGVPFIVLEWQCNNCGATFQH